VGAILQESLVNKFPPPKTYLVNKVPPPKTFYLLVGTSSRKNSFRCLKRLWCTTMLLYKQIVWTVLLKLDSFLAAQGQNEHAFYCSCAFEFEVAASCEIEIISASVTLASL
jgi:hypothetical protein